MNIDDGRIRKLAAGEELSAREIPITDEEAADLMGRRMAERVARLEELRARPGCSNAAKRRARKAPRS